MSKPELGPATPIFRMFDEAKAREFYVDFLRVRIEMRDVDAYQQQLLAKKFKFARPGVQDQPWGTRDMTISDPFDNRLTFYSSTSSPSLPAR